MQQITRKAIKKPLIRISAILLSLFLLLFLFLLTLDTASILFHCGGIQPKTTIHKVMNHNQYNIVIATRASLKKGIFLVMHIYLDIWLDDKIIKSYPLYDPDVSYDYKYRIKDVTLLPDTNEVKVEFDGDYGFSPDGKSRVSVGLYKIVEDQPDSPKKT